jgi:hypothetical protein
VPVKRVQSFEFYGADALPKPARKGGRAEGTARTLGRGVSDGGYIWAILYRPMFPLCYYINGGLMVISPGYNAKGPRF